MPTIAAIDVGSNGIRLAIGMANGTEPPTVLENIRESVRLGQDVFTKGSISEETLDKAVESFKKFRAIIDQHAVTNIKAVATSAAREAMNREIFCDRIMQATGIEITTINAEEEARLIHLGIASKIPLKNKLAMLIDIGGGSVEITLAEGDTIIATESFRMGAVRLLQVLEEKKHGEKRFNQLVREYVESSHKRIKKELGGKKIDVCVGTGGNIEALGDLRKELLKKDRNTVVSLEDLEVLSKKLIGMTYEARIQELQLRPDRADVIVPASMVLHKIVKQAGVEEVEVPHIGLKDGILIDIVENLYGTSKQAHRDQVTASAMAIGRKYSFDEQHGTTVVRLAGKLFDDTRMLHNLNGEYRLLLEVSALLHDIGQFINTTGHHKHTQYLLTANPVIGLTPSEMVIVANVARYHRKSLPKPQHDTYSALSSKDKVVVSKLASILRVADALDNEHASKVADIAVEYKKPKLTLKLTGEGDMLLERWAVARKSGLFEEVFSTKIVLDE